MSQVSKQHLNLSDIDNTTITFNSQGQIQASGGAVNVQTLSGNANIPVPPTAGNIQVEGGTGCTVVEDVPNSKLIVNINGGGLDWNNVIATPQAMVANDGYLTNSGSQIVLTLPATSVFGDKIEVAGFGAGGWQVQQLAGQQIIFGNQSTTLGVGGSLTSTNQFDSLELLCVVANLTWLVLDAQGNITVV